PTSTDQSDFACRSRMRVRAITPVWQGRGRAGRGVRVAALRPVCVTEAMTAPATPHPVRVGISGWRYAPWRGVFYPPGLPQRQELEYAAARLASVEINGSFYSLQRP